MTMPGRALRVLEFERALEYAAGFASTAVGRKAVLAMRPSADGGVVRARLSAVAETNRFLAPRPDWAFPRLPESDAAVRRLAVEGAVLSAGELARLGVLLAAGRTFLRALPRETEGLPELRALGARVCAHRDLENAIVRSVDPEGVVLEGASGELRRLRTRLAGAHNRLVSHLESFLKGVNERYRVPKASVSIREGRYVVPVRREGRRTVGGYVHDESSSGATVFIEPPSAIEMMNRIRELERAEVREIRRILRALSGRCRPLAPALADSMGALTEVDKLVALARTAVRWEACIPEITRGPLAIRSGRHPLLLAAGIDAVPFDLDLGPHERVVVVTGPNAGGKTVFLKSVGLIAALAQAGVVPPVGPGTRLPVFDGFFADVGDEQSIADSLSTFSAHLRNLQEVLAKAGRRSLVLIDEPGAGTDPKEGEALAQAVIEVLAERGCVAVLTSHLGGLKRLARPGGRIVNASLRFDGERLAPTYRFVKGRPGRSYGLAIARGLGFPSEVLDRADACRDRAEARLDELLESLEAKEAKVTSLLAGLDAERDRASAQQRELERREEELGRSEREHAGRARREARQLLLDARREVEGVIADLAARAESRGDLGEAFRDARRSVEAAARALEEPRVGERRGAAGRDEGGVGRGAGGERRERHGGRAAPVPGSTVRVAELDVPGTVVAVEGGRAVVSVGEVRMKVDLAKVVPVRGDERGEGGGAGGTGGRERGERSAPRAAVWGGAVADPTPELDLRGQRAHEAEVSLRRALDDASMADLGALRVIHGKGTGALRKRVSAVLEADERVEDFRAAKPAEGGYGVTVARLR